MCDYDEIKALDPLISPGGSVRSPREKVTALLPNRRLGVSGRYETFARQSGLTLARLARLVREKPGSALIAAAAGGLLAGFAFRRS